MTTNNKAVKSTKKNKGYLQQPAVSPLMSPYVPYLIAGSFVAMTALLTLLLTMVMDNKAELDQVLAGQASNPILTDARMAFGQDKQAQATQSESPALLTEDTAVPPTPTISEQVPVPLESDETIVSETSESSANKDEAPAIVSNNHRHDEPAVANESPAVSKSQPSPLEENITMSDRDIDTVVNAHEERIQDIRAVITLRPGNRQRIHQAISYHLNLMETQVRQIEYRLRPAFPPALATYQRLVNRRRESFHRIMQHRAEVLKRLHESRRHLRERYTQLLDLLNQDSNNIIA